MRKSPRARANSQNSVLMDISYRDNIRNLPDRAVEVFISGPRDLLDVIITDLRGGRLFSDGLPN